MKKEVFLAITIGFALGLVITFGIWTANKSLRQPSTMTTDASPTPQSPTPAAQQTKTPQTNSLVTITSPEDEALFNTATITVSGTTQANLPVILAYETGEQILEADAEGKFSAQVPLEGGYNVISATVFDPNGKEVSSMITVTYTTSKI